jgi:hypothetical protein
LTSRIRKILAEALHQVARLLLLLFILIVAALGMLGYLLSRGPLQIPALASWLATQASGQGIRVHMGEAELAWAGYQQGGGEPLYLKLGEISVRNEAGLELAHIPVARLVFLPEALFGAKAPIFVDGTDARFNGSAVPVSMGAAIWLGAGFHLARAEMLVSLGPGRLGSGDTTLPITSGSFDLRLLPGSASLQAGQLTLAPEGQSAPSITFSGAAALGRQWAGIIRLTADSVQAADLAQYWPQGVLTQTRAWVTRNITSGTASNAAFTVQLGAPGTLASLGVTGLQGGFTGRGLTLHWLPGARPITALNGQMTFLDTNNALVTADSAQLGGLALSAGTLKITGMSQARQNGALGLSVQGSVPALLTILNAPPINLLAQAPPELGHATGNLRGQVTASIPFLADLPFAQVGLHATAELTDVAVATPFQGLNFTLGRLRLAATGQTLSLHGTASLAGEPASLAFTEAFATTEQHVALSGTAGPVFLHVIGLDAQSALADPVAGSAPFTLKIDGNANGAETASLTADLTPAGISAPSFGWAKKPGIPGQLQLGAVLQGGNLASLTSVNATAPGLRIQSQARGRRADFPVFDIGATRAAGVLIAPARPGGAWVADFRGALLDARAISSPPKPHAPPPPPSNAPPSGPAWSVRLAFQRLDLAAPPAPDLAGFTFAGNGVGATLLRANATAQGILLTVTPVTSLRRTLALHAANAGALLQALGAFNGLQGGTLDLGETYGGAAPAIGALNLTKFRILNAPSFAKVLQALTVYGVPAATSGPGLEFDHAIAPYAIAGGMLHLRGARAFSASLGFTASGSIALGDGASNLDATIIPAYALNTLPGKIPLIGHLFTAEKGGGLFAVRAKITGPLTDPKVTVNPLSALTPGVLRDLFGLGGSQND